VTGKRGGRVREKNEVERTRRRRGERRGKEEEGFKVGWQRQREDWKV
jgi:hypothetical protein